MNLKVSYLENTISFNDEKIQIIEIENKKMFYRLVSDLILIKNGENLNELYFYDDKNEELNLGSRVEVYVNFFEFDLNTKKNLNYLYKKINSELSEEDKDDLLNNFKKLYKCFNKKIIELDLPITLSDNYNAEDIVKMFKVSFTTDKDLLSNLLLIIDVEKTLRLNQILFFVNLKLFLSKDELLEFYKYCLYNNVKVVLIDNQSYGATINYEKKLIIDNELEEFVL